MSRLNWIIQRSTDSDRECISSRHKGNWRDCHNCGALGSVSYDHESKGVTYDAYGNKGFQNKKQARAELERMRAKFPDDYYRMVKIDE